MVVFKERCNSRRDAIAPIARWDLPTAACYALGGAPLQWPLCFDPYVLDWNKDSRNEAVSIDRIDSEKAHSQQNCQLTHTRCNCLKQDQFILNA